MVRFCLCVSTASSSSSSWYSRLGLATRVVSVETHGVADMRITLTLAPSFCRRVSKRTQTPPTPPIVTTTIATTTRATWTCGEIRRLDTPVTRMRSGSPSATSRPDSSCHLVSLAAPAQRGVGLVGSVGFMRAYDWLGVMVSVYGEVARYHSAYPTPGSVSRHTSQFLMAWGNGLGGGVRLWRACVPIFISWLDTWIRVRQKRTSAHRSPLITA